MPAATYLDEIVAAHRAAAGADLRDRSDLLRRAEQMPAARGFADRIVDAPGLAVVAEIKRRSPSKGAIFEDLVPTEVAGEYANGGASCLSVLTDHQGFGGSPADLTEARNACDLPVLRKDFTVSEADVCDARLMGADAVLLIVAALTDEELISFHTLAIELGMDALVEVHDAAELDRALDVGAQLIGVNQRDLRTFEVDGSRAAIMVRDIPPEVVAVAESGISGAKEASELARVGYQAILVGESLLRDPDRAKAVSDMRGHPIGSRVAPRTAGNSPEPDRL